MPAVIGVFAAAVVLLAVAGFFMHRRSRNPNGQAHAENHAIYHQPTTHRNPAFDPTVATRGLPAAPDKPEESCVLPSAEQIAGHVYDKGPIPGPPSPATTDQLDSDNYVADCKELDTDDYVADFHADTSTGSRFGRCSMHGAGLALKAWCGDGHVRSAPTHCAGCKLQCAALAHAPYFTPTATCRCTQGTVLSILLTINFTRLPPLCVARPG